MALVIAVQGYEGDKITRIPGLAPLTMPLNDAKLMKDFLE